VEVSLLFDAGFWQNAWEEALALDQARTRAKKTVDVWNRRAKSYNNNAETESGNIRVEETLAFLDAYGILNRQLRILDLGCGPGNFALALAERGHQVVALDPAEKMLAMVEEKLQAKPDCRALITTVQADWVTLSLAEYGWNNYFDLVFASMTPGVTDVDTLQKSMAAAKRHVYLSRFAGPRNHPSVENIWNRFQAKPYYSLSLDILFPLNLLYALGYRPVQHFARWEREHTQAVEDAVEEIKNVLALRMDLDAVAEETIRRYVEERTDKNGMFTEVKGATSAMLLWNIEKGALTRLGG
jgi:SAM-dependent methyltransferase